MDVIKDIADNTVAPLPPAPRWSARVLWVLGLLAVAAVTALAFGAYRQPDLLLNLLGLRYCG